MRKELYEEYKKEFPEELFEIGGLKAHTSRVEKRREKLRGSKLARIDKWRRILDAEDDG